MEAASQAARWLPAFRRIGRDLAAGLSLPRLLSSGMAIAQELFEADRAAIFLNPPVRAVAAFGLSTGYLDTVSSLPPSAPGGQVIKSGVPLVIPDVRAPDAPLGPLREVILAEGYRTLALAPIVYSGEVRGVIALYHDRVVPYPPEAVDMLSLLAEQLALATEAARREQRLLDERRTTERLVEELPVGVVLVDRDGKLLVANREARRLFPRGSMREILAEERPTLDVSGRPIRADKMPVRRALAGTAVLGQTVLVPVSPTQVRSYIVNAIPLGEEALVSFQDTTRARQLDLQKDAFLQIVSHELRSPVTALRIYAGLLRRGSFRPDLVLRVDAQVARLTSLLGKMLEVTAVETDGLRFEPIDVARLVREAAAQARRIQPERTLTVSGASSAPIQGDPARLRRVIDELLENAVLHGAGTVEVDLEASEHRVLLRVSDEGPGVPHDRLPFLFERFSATRAALPAGGLGLGLYVAQVIARGHGGKLGYQERPSGGATFSLLVPVEPAKTLAREEAPRRAPSSG